MRDHVLRAVADGWGVDPGEIEREDLASAVEWLETPLITVEDVEEVLDLQELDGEIWWRPELDYED